jgi:fluoroquinolone resistance protein
LVKRSILSTRNGWKTFHFTDKNHPFFFSVQQHATPDLLYLQVIFIPEKMKEAEHDNQTFDGIDYSHQNISGEEYYDCSFLNCNFSEANLLNSDFNDCRFENCNLSLVKLTNTGLKGVSFKNCKLIGVDFNSTNPFLLNMTFSRCQLDYAGLYQMKLKETLFEECSLVEANFSESDLHDASFRECNLTNAVFDFTNLTHADFRNAHHYTIDPERNQLNQARFSPFGLAGLLGKYNLRIE